MSAESLILEHIDLWTSTIKSRNTRGRGQSNKRELYGINKLRELILDLAVRGKLVPQNPSDEPASVLLERIKAEKEQLIKNKKIKKQKPFPEITNEEKPFDLPSGWGWCKLGDLTEMYNGRAFKSSEWVESGIPIVRIQNLNNKDADFNYFDGELSEVNRIDNGSFLISWSGTPGTSFGAFIWSRGEAALNQHINNCVFNYPKINLEFMRLAVNGCMNHFITKAQGAVGLKHVTKGTLNNAIIGFPTEKEQHLIVAKVDELMALCDQLEQQTESSLDAHNLLVDTLLVTLTNSQDANQLNDNWILLADHFDSLIITDYAVEQLRKTILQLAVMGKLVPQNPKDEPASELLKRIASEKEKLINDKYIKKPKPLSEITEEEKPFELPMGWEWERLGHISHLITDGAHHTPTYIDSGVPFLSVKDMSSGVLSFDDTKYISKEQHEELTKRCHPKKGDLLLTKIGTTGVPVIIDTDVEFSLFVSVALIKFPVDKLSGPFLSLLIKSPVVKKQSTEGTQGVGNKNLVLKTIATFKLAIPPFNEQLRITAKVDELMTFCDQLKARIYDAQNIQIKITDALVTKVTGNKIKDIEKMKVPENELLATLKLKVSPNDNEQAPLSSILSKHKGELTAKNLWQLSKMDIDVFYQQLKVEMEPGWVIEPKKAEMKEKV